ncbi:MAG: hypothetical protein PVG97_08235 [Syntrophobacterales bacterium]|jgi:4-hydroxy-tetrahydrodipicolinate reductase
MNEVKVVQIGLGPLGQKIAQFIDQRKTIKIIGAVDQSPEISGENLEALCRLEQNKLTIETSITECLKEKKPDVVILTTVSSMDLITPQIEEIVSLGLPVVTTCEELSFPWGISNDLANRIDHAAKKNNVAVLATGVNPGFLMDALPLFVTSVCQEVKNVKVSRIQDASFRRIPFQKKIGAGLTLEKFEEARKRQTIRHVGLEESIKMIAYRLGWTLSKTEDVISPIIAKEEIKTENMFISPGMCAGVQQIAKGYVNADEKITLEFRASIGETNPHDTIEISGNPNIRSTIDGGLNGDVATCAITINAIKQVLNAEAGLRTMADIPILSYYDF